MASRARGGDPTVHNFAYTPGKLVCSNVIARHAVPIPAMIIRPVKYLNHGVEQDHRAVKRVTRPVPGFKSCAAAQGTLVGIELMHMLKKGQMTIEAGTESLTLATKRQRIIH